MALKTGSLRRVVSGMGRAGCRKVLHALSRRQFSTTKRLQTLPKSPGGTRGVADLSVEEDAVLSEVLEQMHDSPEATKAVFATLPRATREMVVQHWKQTKRQQFTQPTWEQKVRLALLAGMPMVGFGFMDNAVMICAGDYIDTTLCVSMGLTTLFAAGCGNIISDIAGVATAGPIEAITRNTGIKGHGMSAAQLRHSSVIFYKYAGTAVGMTIGCIIGMFPLLWPERYRMWQTRAEAEAELQTS
ncbi:hypothetical protein DIPPA_31495 [Diplonema papillatum]|nr:hypothetical protein DIPPA_31495 [Diplonema papillatum]